MIDGDEGFDIIDYNTLDAGVTLAATGFIRKGGVLGGPGEDNFNNIDKIIGDSEFTNTIDGQTPTQATASLDVDLGAGTLAVILSGPGNPIQIEVENFDNVIGSDNADSITGDGNTNILSGGDDNDVITGRGGSDSITGDAGDDSLFGGQGNDDLVGGLGNDSITGGEGKDKITGVGADLGVTDLDQLTGGKNTDTFVLGDETSVFYVGEGFAQILDFKTEVDTIQLNGAAGDYTFGALNRTIAFEGDLIATTNEAFNINTDFTFV